MMHLKYRLDHVSTARFWLSLALVAVVMVTLSMLWSEDAKAAPASPTSVSESCYPTDGDPTGERCDEERTDDGAVEWDAYDETPKCVGYVAFGTLAGAGGGLTGAAYGAAGGAGTCWVNTW